MKYFNITRRILLVGMLALVFSGCEDNFTVPPVPTGKSIAVNMESDPNFTLWTAITKRVGLYNSLDNPNSGVVTIFGPSDPAFITYMSTTFSGSLTLPITEASLIAFIDGLSGAALTSFVSTLVPVLNYHIVSSKLLSTQLTGNQTFATLNSARLSVSVVNSVILLNGNSATNGATVTSVDMLGSNGVAHTIDHVMAVPGVANVLLPLNLSISYTTNPPTVATSGATTDGSGTNFNLLTALIRYTGLVPTLVPNASPLPEFTIFQATDASIIAYLTTIDATLNTELACYNYISTITTSTSTAPTLDDLTKFVQYHIVPGRYLGQDFTDGQTLVTLLTDKNLTAGVVLGPPAVYTIKDLNAAADPTVTAANIITNSGVLHTISGVLRSN